VALVPASTGLTAPNWGTHAPGLDGYLFVTDQPGTLWAIHLASGAKKVFADVSGLLSGLLPVGGLGARDFLPFDERGLLGVAFHPEFASNRLLYTYTSEAAGGPADFPIVADLTPEHQAQFDAQGLTYPNHQSVIREWTAIDPANPQAGVAAVSRVLLRVDQPQFNHNAGALAFDNDGMLLIALGDGGGADDQPEKDQQDFVGVPIFGHGEVGNGQNPGTVLGSIPRIDPWGNNSRNGQYGVPADNPFAVPGDPAGGQVGCEDGFCDEAFAYGFHNPFRMSVDRPTGLILTGDVGQNDIEEVDVVVSGGNYGWKLKEGTFLFDPNVPNAGVVPKDSPGTPPELIDPVAQYDHDEGVSVIGGYVYRGKRVSRLRGRYVFGEYTRPPFDPGAVVCDGRLFALKERADELAKRIHKDDKPGKDRPRPPARAFEELQLAEPLAACVLGFAQDAHGEVYVLTNTTGIPDGDTGTVLKIVRP
jgi:glucose/arabinose dehydrogenase